jgi:hypothetical protein
MLSRLRLLGANLLIAAVLALVLIEALPQSPPAVRTAVQPLTQRLGLSQSWSVFVSPDQVNTRLRAEIAYADGRTATWRSPDWPQLSPWQRFTVHRRSEWLDNIWTAANAPQLSPALASWARYLARSQRPNDPLADRGAEVKIIVEQAAIPAAEVRPWKSWRTPLPFDEATTLAIEKLP